MLPPPGLSLQRVDDLFDFFQFCGQIVARFRKLRDQRVDFFINAPDHRLRTLQRLDKTELLLVLRQRLLRFY